jgi:NAD(P)-dependent dehydrogenase (short-subunit alcohol dehydrogenase family)
VSVQRCRTELHPVPALDPPGRGALDGATVVVLGGGRPGRADVAGAVTRHGGRAVQIDTSTGPDQAAARATGADIVVDLNLTGHPSGSGSTGAVVEAGAWRPALLQTYAVLRAVAPDWGREQRTDRCFYVAVMDAGGHLGSDPRLVRQPLCGIWAGLAKTLPRELPNCNVRVIDPHHDADLGQTVVAEISAGRFLEVGWAGGRRHVLLPRPTDPGVEAEPVQVDPGSAVVVTGGGRGIGLRLARHLRARWGCQVVVTGRHDPVDGDEAVYRLDDDAFRRHTRQILAGCRGGDEIRAARLAITRLGREREAWRNLAEARAAGQELGYRRCDVTDPGDVRALLDSVAGPLAAVVHNAGIDLAARLGAKSDTDVADVVATKVDGFVNLVDAIGDRPLSVLCAVGSLTGRFGGTAGQSDYAGANEGLARLSEWTGVRRPFPVTCLSWPTWDNVGLITSPAAAVREMSAIPVEVGVTAWERELRAPQGGEVLYLGQVRALSPGQLRGLPLPSDFAGSAGLARRRQRLGRLRRWVPAGLLESSHALSAAMLPASSGFRVAGTPSVPVSMLLELAIDAASWLLPEESPPPAALCALEVSVGSLRLPASGTLDLVRRAHARWEGRRPIVEVRFLQGPGECPVAQVALSCSAGPEATPTEDGPRPAGTTGPLAVPGRPAVLPDRRDSGISWSVSAGVMSMTGTGRLRTVSAEPVLGADLDSGVHSPEPVLPVGVLEGLLWATCPGEATSDWLLRADEIRFTGSARHAAGAQVDLTAGTATAHDLHANPVMSVSGLRWSPR